MYIQDNPIGWFWDNNKDENILSFYGGINNLRKHYAKGYGCFKNYEPLTPEQKKRLLNYVFDNWEDYLGINPKIGTTGIFFDNENFDYFYFPEDISVLYFDKITHIEEEEDNKFYYENNCAGTLHFIPISLEKLESIINN